MRHPCAPRSIVDDQRRLLAVSAPLALLLGACGGGGSGSTSADTGTGSSTGGSTTAGAVTGTDANGASVAPATTTTVGAWRLETGANAGDTASTLVHHRLAVALGSGAITSGSASLTVGATVAGRTEVGMGGVTVVVLQADALGLTVTSTLPATARLELALSGSGTQTVTVHSAQDYRLALEGVTLASTDGPALNLQSRQRAFVVLTGSNTLTDTATYTARTGPDAAAMDLKATFFAEGPLLLSGSGSLDITAAAKHALASDAHIRLVSGTVSVNAVKKDGVRANHAFVMDGGSLTITTPAGKGIKVEGKEDAAAAVGFIAINAGTLAITSHDKAITASWEGAEDGSTTATTDDPDPRVTINGGAITITTTGTPVEGTLAPEGIEGKSSVTINGGSIIVNSTDDAINAGKSIVINGGFVLARASRNDAIDSNGTLTINGGVVVADGASGAEGGMDCDNNNFTVTGGTFIGLGGRNSSVTSSLSTQNCVTLRNLAAGLVVLRDANGRPAFAFTMPRTATAVVLSSPLLATGTGLTPVSGGMLAAGGAEFNGLVQNAGTHSGGTALAAAFTIASRVTAL